MLNKNPNDVTFEDIQRLVDTEQQEGYQLDYKVDLSLPIKGDDKKEFLRDITSFANTYGGYLILGVEEDKGIPTGNIPGLTINDLDRFKLDIENIIRDSIEPRLFAHTIRDFKLESGQYVIAIHIPRSWNPPHRALGDQFFSRNSAGKFPLSVEQMRRVFTQGADNLERIRRFVRERVFLVNAGEGAIPLSPDTPKIILHVLPLLSFDSTLILPIGHHLLTTMTQMTPFGDQFIGNWDNGYNADGLIWKTTNTVIGSYTQLFRNGIIEGASNGIIFDTEKQQLSATSVERAACFSLACIFTELRNISIISPVVISLSLIGVKNYSISKPRDFYGSALSQDSLFLPEVTLEEFTSLLGQEIDESCKLIAPKLKGMFDALWQAFGYASSPNFNGDDWKPRD
jgi:Putative DNA-binding domain